MSSPRIKAKSDKGDPFRKPSVERRERKFQAPTKCHNHVKFKPLPLLKDCKAHQREDLFIKKLENCCFIFNFLNPSSNMQSRDMKTATLIELGDFILEEKRGFSERLYPHIIKMVSVNVFRPFPSEETYNELGNDSDEEIFEDASWTHLKLVYQFFLKFLDLPDFDPAIGSKYINEEFLIQLLETFNSKDPRERAYVKTALHRIYGKLLTRRSFIRQHINNIFLRFIYETENMNGIGELLEIFGSIINGFVLPLKLEHKVFLQKVLIPLHKPASLCLYHTQLTYCIMQFIDKDPNLIEQVIQGLLKFWPVTCSQKQVMFLNEIEEILDGIDGHQFEKIQEPVFKKIAQCISSSHFLVSQRALYFWNNDDIVSLMEGNCNVIMPIVFPALYCISKDHWNQVILDLVVEVLRLFENIHPELYNRLKEQVREKKTESQSTAAKA